MDFRTIQNHKGRDPRCALYPSSSRDYTWRMVYCNLFLLPLQLVRSHLRTRRRDLPAVAVMLLDLTC